MAVYTVQITDGTTLSSLAVNAGRGPKGDGWTGVTYDNNTGRFTFTSNDGLGYVSDSITADLDTAVTEAEAAQAAAEAAQAATENIFDQFGDQYLGPKASDPTVDNDGDPLTEGDIYFNTTDDVLKFYSGSAWVAPESIATTAATAAQAAQTAAETAETNAETAETNAATSASNASTSETNAASSAAAASTSADEAAASATSIDPDSIDINGGTIDGTVIGGSTPAAGSFTTLSASTSITGTLATAAQTNITSVGSLTSLDVTGTVTADGLTVDGSATLSGQLRLNDTNYWINNSGGSDISYRSGGTHNFYSGGFNQRLNIASNGDISFYEDTGTTPKFFWDASAESLGIGTSSPSAPLAINVATNGAYAQRIGVDDPGVGTISSVKLGFDVKSIGLNPEPAAFIGVEEASTSSVQGALTFATRQINNNTIAPTEAMRIDSSGNLLVGTTSTSLFSGDEGEGFAYRAGNEFTVARASAAPVTFVRQTDDGTIVNFKKDTANVGSIGTFHSRIHIGNDGGSGNSAFLRFKGDTNDIRPCDSGGSNRDNAIDLGSTSARFKDLYLSGGVYLGGTGSANKLDDYEEGTWTPDLQINESTTGITYIVSPTGRYTKIGNMVFVDGVFSLSSKGSLTGSVSIVGLPFPAWNYTTQTILETGSQALGFYTGTSGIYGNMSWVINSGTYGGLLRYKTTDTDNLDEPVKNSQITNSFSARVNVAYRTS